MIETNNPEVNVDEIMEKIGEEVSRRREHKASEPALGLADLIFQAPFESKVDNNYHINQ